MNVPTKTLTMGIFVLGVFGAMSNFAQAQSSANGSSSSSPASFPWCGGSSSSVSTSSAPASALQCTVATSNSWNQGYQMTVQVTNTGNTPINGWNVSLELPTGHSINNSWDATLHQPDGQFVTVTNNSWNGQLQPGQLASFGVQGAHPGTFVQPVCHVNNSVANQAPIVDFTITTHGPTIFVDTQGSTDPNGDNLKFTIAFGDGEQINYTKAWHTYRYPGEYTVTVTATDGKLSTSHSKAITATQHNGGNRAPIAMMSLDSSNGYVSVATGASFDVDGDPLTKSVNQGHSLSTGNYSWKVLTVFDGELGDTIQSGIMAGCGIYAHIRARANITHRVEGQTIFVDASDSTNTYSVNWDFGDGTTSNQLITSHTYAQPGQYTLKLSAISMPYSDFKSLPVEVGNGINNPPQIGGIYAKCEESKIAEGNYLTRCYAPSVYDPDEDDLAITWNMGDGTSYVTHSAQEVVTHRYLAAGPYTVNISVSDGELAATTNAYLTSKGNDPLTSTPPALCSYSVTSDWSNGFSGKIQITNTSSNPIEGWNVNWQYQGNNRITSSWNANVSGNNPYTAGNLSWNSVIQPGASIEIGFVGSKSGTAEIPQITGAICQ